MNSLTILGLLAAFAFGYAVSEFHRAYLAAREMRARNELIGAMLWADHIQNLVRLGLIVEVAPGHYHRNPDLTDEEAQAIALANGLDI
jgi:hypothetical protein